ncbi:MAG: sensor histidine kinase [Thaumarchaeota archaeon]|nr:sensor histidine kinase [Nitrososphaerota archaeon]
MPDRIDFTETGEEHKMIVDPVGLISEIINNIADPRDIIRELISNAASKEVGAKKVKILVYESEKGLAITVDDDGRGMNYTNDPKNPGRLDKFLNAAQATQAGFESDEFGAKGFGAKLLYNAERVEVETWDGGENGYRVILNEPRMSILDQKILCKPLVSKVSPALLDRKGKGTSIIVKGWAGNTAIPKDFKLDRLERYLRYYTVVGYTKLQKRNESLPEFELQIGAQLKPLKAGFPYIVSGNQDDTKTVDFGPIEIEKKTTLGKPVKITLRGGVTTETGKFDLTEDRGGVWLSMNGIPYFKLPTNKFSRKLNMTDDFARFVVECNDVRLNLARSDFSSDETYDALEDALNEAFLQIKEDPKFQKFYLNRHLELRISMQEKMNKKKEEFSSEDKKYVWYKNKLVIAEPESEYDTAALLWILEGMGALPFAKFKTLQYPGYREGIDMLVNIQEERDQEEKICAYAELERLFSNLIKHKHDIGQMSLAFCWKADSSKVTQGKLESTKKPYRFVYNFGGMSIPVFEISSFPGIFSGTKREAENHFESTNRES